MAIFGDLSDLPFPEIFNMIGRRNGRLVVSDSSGDWTFVLELVEGSLRGLRVKGEEIADALEVRDRLAALMEAPRGSFVFHRSEAEELSGSLDLSIPPLLISMALTVDELSAYHDRFAPPSMQFKQLSGAAVWLDDDLCLFFERATPFLSRGADAVELSHELRLSVEQVQLNLYKLCSAGLVAPACVFESAPTAPG